MGKITIAIDGYSSTGKSTIAKQLAKALDYVYIDTGAMYRAVTLYALQNKFIAEHSNDTDAIVESLSKINLEFAYNDRLGYSEMYLNGVNVEKEIRTLEVSKYVSRIAEIKEVREMLVGMQREMGEAKGVVMDGRDIGTVVFPNAELKVFMTASPEKRAYRRYKELLEKGEEVTYEEILKNVALRDRIDSSREFSPLRKADGAITFDNSDMGLQEQFERLHNYAKRVIESKNKKGTP
ncbi:(d)CMP kinase [Ulvibacterium marinum]|uniref:Cytidylate kinase n=1 Tax=Ulvibacterium marinum TaxID=2419782 RepID=A0A3B0C0D5_9FLAO|nr:(d)CMP kinase [Ulvibacterium marinum]RKN78028.1 (d)CMP kinase [Ulvibacterium marinum]